MHYAAQLRAAGMQLVGVPVDDDGLQVTKGLQLAPHARAAVVTPAHQSPAAALSLRRRLALLDGRRASRPGSSKMTTTASIAM
jgi:GntR family transcriptional regulator/MocR family aminotransferase